MNTRDGSRSTAALSFGYAGPMRTEMEVLRGGALRGQMNNERASHSIELRVQIFHFQQMHDAALLSSAVQSGIADRLVLAPAIVRRDREEARAHHPTLPSRLTEISFCASTANSMGSCCSTSLTNPLTTRATASSAESPRCLQ